MRQIGATVLLLVVVLAIAVPRNRADEKGEAKKQHSLVGTWKLVSAKWGQREIKIPEEITRLKHVTPTHFTWVVYDKDGKVMTILGGRYVVQGDVYEETPEYGTGMDALRGKVQTFNWKVDGNKWHHNGKLSSGLTIEEVWERVEKK